MSYIYCRLILAVRQIHGPSLRTVQADDTWRRGQTPGAATGRVSRESGVAKRVRAWQNVNLGKMTERLAGDRFPRQAGRRSRRLTDSQNQLPDHSYQVLDRIGWGQRLRGRLPTVSPRTAQLRMDMKSPEYSRARGPVGYAFLSRKEVSLFRRLIDGRRSLPVYHAGGWLCYECSFASENLAVMARHIVRAHGAAPANEDNLDDDDDKRSVRRVGNRGLVRTKSSLATA
jgi:hypothetical protein